MAATPKTLAPRYFKHSLVRTAEGLVEVEKRLEYPMNLRKSHVMVTGGREGSMVSKKSVPPSGESTRTGWKGGPSPGWTEELDADKTLEDSRTQAPYLRQVRPEQRAWARGVMRVPDIEKVLYGRPPSNTAIDLDVPGTPNVELTLWISDEGLFASITGKIEAIRVVTVEDASSLGVNEAAKTIENAAKVSNKVPYAEMMGVVFIPDQISFFGSGAVALPYFLIGRARRISSAAGHEWRVSSKPTASANKPVDLGFAEKLEGIEKIHADARAAAALQAALSPLNQYEKRLTPHVTLKAKGDGSEFSAMRLSTIDPSMGTPGLADELSLMNVYRTAGAKARSLRGKTQSVLEEPHDPLDFTQKRRKRKKAAPKDPLKMYSNPRISGVNYLLVSAAELPEMARRAGMSVEQFRREYRVITRKEAALLRKQEAAQLEKDYASTTYSRPPFKPHTPRANPFMAETLQDAIEAMTLAHRYLYYELKATSGGQSRATIEYILSNLKRAIMGLGGESPRH